MYVLSAPTIGTNMYTMAREDIKTHAISDAYAPQPPKHANLRCFRPGRDKRLGFYDVSGVLRCLLGSQTAREDVKKRANTKVGKKPAFWPVGETFRKGKPFHLRSIKKTPYLLRSVDRLPVDYVGVMHGLH